MIRGGDWVAALNSVGAQDMAWLASVFRDRPWWSLRPDRDHKVVTGGYGTFGKLDYVTAAGDAEGKLALAYVPSPGATKRELTVDLGHLAGPVAARWFNPATGGYLTVEGSPFRNTGRRPFTPPGDHGTGTSDWLLILEITDRPTRP